MSGNRETVRPLPKEAREKPDAPEHKSWPLAATIICCVLVLFSAIGAQGQARVPTGNEAYDAGYLVGSTVGVGIILWGIAWLITIRHASRGWKWGSFAAVMGFAVIGGLARG